MVRHRVSVALDQKPKTVMICLRSHPMWWVPPRSSEELDPKCLNKSKPATHMVWLSSDGDSLFEVGGKEK